MKETLIVKSRYTDQTLCFLTKRMLSATALYGDAYNTLQAEF